MKRTCGGCHALKWDAATERFNCDLNYDIDEYNTRPLEECPKPKTSNELKKIRDDINLAARANDALWNILKGCG